MNPPIGFSGGFRFLGGPAGGDLKDVMLWIVNIKCLCQLTNSNTSKKESSNSGKPQALLYVAWTGSCRASFRSHLVVIVVVLTISEWLLFFPAFSTVAVPWFNLRGEVISTTVSPAVPPNLSSLCSCDKFALERSPFLELGWVNRLEKKLSPPVLLDPLTT